MIKFKTAKYEIKLREESDEKYEIKLNEGYVFGKDGSTKNYADSVDGLRVLIKNIKQNERK